MTSLDVVPVPVVVQVVAVYAVADVPHVREDAVPVALLLTKSTGSTRECITFLPSRSRSQTSRTLEILQ